MSGFAGRVDLGKRGGAEAPRIVDEEAVDARDERESQWRRRAEVREVTIAAELPSPVL